MFNITSKSTSYRFLVHWNEKIKMFDSDRAYYCHRFPNTFCQYYRMVIATALKLFAFGVLIFALIPNAIYDVIYGISQVGFDGRFIGLTIQGSPWPMQVALLFGLIGLLFSSVVAFVFSFIASATFIGEIYGKLKNKLKKDKTEQEKKEPSLFSVARDAYKNKFCPIVSFVEEDNEQPN